MKRPHRYLVVGTKLLPDDFPYVHTADHKKADKWLKYCRLKYPEYSWRIKLYYPTQSTAEGG